MSSSICPSSSNRLRGAGLLAVALLGSACMPTAEVRSPKVDDVSWDAVDAHIVVEAENPWPVDITVNSLEGTVTVGEVEVLRHRESQPITVEAFSEKKVRFDFSVKTKDLLQAADGAISSGTTPYRLEGTVTLDTPVGEVDVPLSSTGELPALQPPTTRLPDIKVKDFNLAKGTVDLVFAFKVDNPNELALTVRKVKYGARLTGLDVIKGQTPSVELAAASVSTLRLPVHLDGGSIARGMAKAVKQGKLKGEAFIKGTADTPWGVLPLDLSRSGQVSFK